jgi:hypothetical protein
MPGREGLASRLRAENVESIKPLTERRKASPIDIPSGILDSSVLRLSALGLPESQSARHCLRADRLAIA